MKKSELIEEIRALSKKLEIISAEDKKKADGSFSPDTEGKNEQPNFFLSGKKDGSKTIYADLYDFAGVGYLVLDEEGIIKSLNKTAFDILDVVELERSKYSFSRLISKEDVNKFFDHLNNLKNNKKKEMVELCLQINQRNLYCQLLSIPIRDSGDIYYRTLLTDISEKKELETNIRTKEGQLSAIFNQVVVGIVQFDLDGIIIMVNKKFCEISGRTEEELIGLNIIDITYSEDVPHKVALLKSLSPANPHLNYEKRYIKPDRKIVCVNNSVSLITDQNNIPRFIVTVVEDITSRKLIEKTLQESETRFRLMADTTPALVWMTNSEGTITYMNQTRIEFCGGKSEDHLNDNWQKYIHPDDLQKVIEVGNEFRKKRVSFQHEYRLKDANGEYRWILDKGMPRFSAEGMFTGFIGSGIDITDIKESEKKLAFLAEASTILNSSLDYNITLKSLAYLTTPQLADWCVIDLLDGNNLQRLAVSHIDPEKVKYAYEVHDKYGTDDNGNTGVWNVIRTGKSELYPEITEYMLKEKTKDEEYLKIIKALGLESAIIVPLKIREKIFGALTLIYAQSGRHYTEVDLSFAENLANRAALAIDNAVLYRESHNLNLKLEEQVKELHVEIEERKKARQELLASEEKFRQLAENIKSVFYIIDPVINKFIYLSPSFEEMWGMPANKLYLNRHKWLELVHPDDRVKFKESRLDLSPENDTSQEFRIIKPDGTIRWIHSKAFPIRNESGEVYRIVGVSEDITDRKSSEEKIKNSLMEKEVLLKEIHHRVKNNLQIISSLLNLQSNQIKDEHAQEILIDSQNRVRAMALVHEKLYDFKDLTRINLEGYISDLTSIIINSYGEKSDHIKMKLEIEKIMLNIDMAIGLGLIINELISNTFKHAFPDGRNGEVCVIVKTDKHKTLTVSVIDNGIGFPSSIDFHKTDSLGLQLVNTLVEQHWGKIELNVNGGTKFKISFPELKYS